MSIGKVAVRLPEGMDLEQFAATLTNKPQEVPIHKELMVGRGDFNSATIQIQWNNWVEANPCKCTNCKETA